MVSEASDLQVDCCLFFGVLIHCTQKAYNYAQFQEDVHYYEQITWSYMWREQSTTDLISTQVYLHYGHLTQQFFQGVLGSSGRFW